MSTRVHTTNPTHVKSIPGSEIEIIIRASKEGERISALFGDISSYAPAGSRVTVAAGAGNTMKSFDFGSIGCISSPSDNSLAELDESKPRTFRLLVWDEMTKQIIAGNERLRARDYDEPAGRQPLLPVRPAALGGEVWRLALTDDNPPELLVNKEIPNIKSHLATRADWQALIIPEAVRQALIHVARSTFDPEDKDAWQAKWIKFVLEVGCEQPHEIGEWDDEQIREWADDVVSTFALAGAYAQRLTQQLGGDEND